MYLVQSNKIINTSPRNKSWSNILSSLHHPESISTDRFCCSSEPSLFRPVTRTVPYWHLEDGLHYCISLDQTACAKLTSELENQAFIHFPIYKSHSGFQCNCVMHVTHENAQRVSAILKHGCGGAVRHSPSPKNPGSNLLTLVWDWADPVKWDQPKPQLSVNTLHWWASSQRTNHKITSSGVVLMTEKEGSLCARENLLRKAPSP